MPLVLDAPVTANHVGECLRVDEVTAPIVAALDRGLRVADRSLALEQDEAAQLSRDAVQVGRSPRIFSGLAPQAPKEAAARESGCALTRIARLSRRSMPLRDRDAALRALRDAARLR